MFPKDMGKGLSNEKLELSPIKPPYVKEVYVVQVKDKNDNDRLETLHGTYAVVNFIRDTAVTDTSVPSILKVGLNGKVERLQPVFKDGKLSLEVMSKHRVGETIKEEEK